MKTRILTLTLIGAALIFTGFTDKKKKEAETNVEATKGHGHSHGPNGEHGDAAKKASEIKEHGHSHGPNGEHSSIPEAQKKRLDSIKKANGGFLIGPQGQLVIPEDASEEEKKRLEKIIAAKEKQIKEHGHSH
ncbi:hypothetical protein [Maribacter sp. 2304DJ31-5]|uniref:hypothetical protein n=1 Tax=Maribacter sp. 2304DJ31-5 TaxID=3386273 RepID=UPI0039BD74F8